MTSPCFPRYVYHTLYQTSNGNAATGEAVAVVDDTDTDIIELCKQQKAIDCVSVCDVTSPPTSICGVSGACKTVFKLCQGQVAAGAVSLLNVTVVNETTYDSGAYECRTRLTAPATPYLCPCSALLAPPPAPLCPASFVQADHCVGEWTSGRVANAEVCACARILLPFGPSLLHLRILLASVANSTASCIHARTHAHPHAPLQATTRLLS